MRNRSEPELEEGLDPYPLLLTKYALLAVYGIGSEAVGVITITTVAGETWGVIWPVLIAVFAIASFLATLRSKYTHRFLLETIATLMLIALLAGYVVAIIVRTLNDGLLERLPVGLLPVILSITPAARLLDLARPHVKLPRGHRAD